MKRCSPAPFSRAFTLIEVLIVSAMISILSGAFFTVTMMTIRAETEENLRSTLRQEAFGAMRAILRDAYLARVQSAGALAGVLPSGIQAGSQTLILRTSGEGKFANGLIVYRVEGPRLQRLKWDNRTATPTVQTLSGHVRSARIERSGNLVRVELELAINRYTKDFTAKYAFTTSVGGVYSVGQVGNLSAFVRPAEFLGQVANLSYAEGPIGPFGQIANLSYAEGVRP